MPDTSTLKCKKRGVSLILLTLMVGTVLIPMVGLAIDGSILFMVKAKLQSAVDAASLAGGRSLAVGLDLPTQIASCTAATQAYFNANFPPGWFGAASPSVAVNIAQTGFKTRTVTVTASVQSPLYFMRILGLNSSTVAAAGQASRRDVNLILVLDRSNSMQAAGACVPMRDAAIDFVNKFTEGRDRMGLITFMTAAHLDYSPTLTFKTQSPSMTSTIGTLVCGGDTGTAQSLWMAYQRLQAINEPGALNIIVFFTDGNPNGIVATFPVKTAIDNRYSVTSPSTIVLTAASPCTVTTTLPLGAIAENGASASTGRTDGIYNSTGVAINSTSQPLVTSPNCSYTVNGSRYMRRDVAFIPATDTYGHATTGYTALELFSGPPYDGQIRPDTPTSILKASLNLSDNTASIIRADTNLTPVIYTIGLGGTSSNPLDDVFLERVANDPRSPIYDPSKIPGKYVFSPNAAQLTDAFNQIASEILRLAQ